MAWYDERYGRGERGNDRGLRSGRSRYPQGGRSDTGTRDTRGAGTDSGVGGWGMTRMNRQMLSGARGSYNPPLGGRTEYSRGGENRTQRDSFGSDRRDYGDDFRSRRGGERFGPGNRYESRYAREYGEERGELHGVRLDRSRYERS
jgi:hypothetical protein